MSSITTERTKLYWGADLGFTTLKKRIAGNKLKLRFLDLPESTTFQYVIKADITDADIDSKAANTFTTAAGQTSQDLDVDLIRTVFTAGDTYYIALQETTNGQEEIQVKFEISGDAVLSEAGTIVNNFLSAEYALSGNPIETTNKIVDQDSLDTTISGTETDSTVPTSLAVKTYVDSQLGADVDFKDFTPITAPAYQEGRVWYDSDDNALSYYDNYSGTSIQLGKELVIDARNNTGSTILDGQVVYISGSTGSRPTVALARASSISTAHLIGVATQDIANNSEGKITVFGEVRNIDTSSFSDGDVLYLSSSTAGELTTTPPVSPDLVIEVGVIERSHVTQGVILVKPKQLLSNNDSLGTSQIVPATQNAVKNYVDNKLKASTQYANTIKKMYNGETVKIVCFGDSITYGYLNPTTQATVPYPTRLQTFLREAFNNVNITVVNAGVSGNTSTDLVNRLSTDVEAENPDLVIAMYGANDVQQGLTFDTFYSNTKTIIDSALTNSYALMFVTPNPIDDITSGTTETVIGRKLENYNQYLKSIVTSYGFEFYDLHDRLYKMFSNNSINPFVWRVDSIHPNERGYTDIANLIVFDKFLNGIDLQAYNDQDTSFIRLVGNTKFLNSNLNNTSTSSDSDDPYRDKITINNTDTDTLTAYVFVNKTNQDIVLESMKDTNGGSLELDIVDYSTTTNYTVNYNEDRNEGYNARDVIVRKAGYGLYKIVFDPANFTVNGNAYLSAFRLQPTNIVNPVYTFSGSDLPTLTEFKNAKGAIKQINYVHGIGTQYRGVIFENGQFFNEGEGTQNLVINFDRIESHGGGFSFFSRKADTGNYNPGIVVWLSGLTLFLDIYTSSRSYGTRIAAASTAHGLTFPATNVTLRIQYIPSTSTIEVYLNGTLEITYTNTTNVPKHRSGFAGIWSATPGFDATLSL